ncbi:MAG: PIN domain nuclease [Acidobacteria bacterium]|nr:MAG: PIN domain nuclease [Acidobacteriota bacterium]
MNVLLDTHALIWWFGDATRLSKRANSVIADANNTILISAAVAWEMAIKASLGKLNALSLVMDLPNRIDQEGFVELPINLEQATRAGLLPMHHRDPFDRLLIAQAQSMNVPILSADAVLDGYDVKRFW